MLDFLASMVPILLLHFVAGIAVAIPLLKNSKLGLYEKVLFGFILGLIVPPFVSFLFRFFGMTFSLPIAYLSFMSMLLAGVLWCHKDIDIRKLMNIDFSGSKWRIVCFSILTLIIVWAFWLRMLSFTPVFYEFDPYYYMYSARQIIVGGEIPLHDLTAWYPQGASHRSAPIPAYLMSSWYAIYTNGGAYDTVLLSMISNVYPPLVGALIVFLLFVLVREFYGEALGLVAAFLCATIPIFIQKFAHGEAEIQPWGIFSILLFITAYALLISRKDRRLAILAGVAAVSIILGSQYYVLLTLIFGGYVFIQSLYDFVFRNDIRDTLIINGIVLLFISFASLLACIYFPGHPILERYLLILSSYLFSALLGGIGFMFAYYDRRICSVIVIATIILAAMFTPVVKVVYLILTETYELSGQLGAISLTVSENASSHGTLQMFLGWVASGVGGVSLVDIVFVCGLFALGYSLLNKSRVALLFGMFIFPLALIGGSPLILLISSFVGIHIGGTAKYVLHLGYAFVLAYCVLFGELVNSLKSDRTPAILIACFLALFLISEPSFSNGVSFNGASVKLTQIGLDSAYWTSDGEPDCHKIYDPNSLTPHVVMCDRIPDYWVESLSWIRNNTNQDARVLVWWDYGHWINFFGERDTVIRGEHTYKEMDLFVADRFVDSNETELADFMSDYGSDYVIFDYGLVGKWDALNYLSCVYNNETSFDPAGRVGTSICEEQHRLETIYVPVNADYCEDSFVRSYSSFGEVYCANVTNRSRIVLRYENNLSRINNVQLRSGRLVSIRDPEGRSRDAYAFTALYFEDSWEDRTGRFYDSNFYKGFFLGELRGFDKVYEYRDEDGVLQLVIYRIIST